MAHGSRRSSASDGLFIAGTGHARSDRLPVTIDHVERSTALLDMVFKTTLLIDSLAEGVIKSMLSV